VAQTLWKVIEREQEKLFWCFNMSVKISGKQKQVKSVDGLETINLYRECENGHFTLVKSKYKTYWDEHCVVCGGKIVR
jgi:hypothetical protein